MRPYLNILNPFGEYLVWTEAVIEDGLHQQLSIIQILSTGSAT